DPVVKVWDARTGEELLVLKGHKAFVSDVVFSPDGNRLVSCGNNFQERSILTKEGQVVRAKSAPEVEVKVWNAQTGKEVFIFKLPIKEESSRLVLSPDGSRLALISGSPWESFRGEGSQVWVWDVQTGKELWMLKVFRLGRVGFSPDGKRLAANAER